MSAKSSMSVRMTSGMEYNTFYPTPEEADMAATRLRNQIVQHKGAFLQTDTPSGTVFYLRMSMIESIIVRHKSADHQEGGQ